MITELKPVVELIKEEQDYVLDNMGQFPEWYLIELDNLLNNISNSLSNEVSFKSDKVVKEITRYTLNENKTKVKSQRIAFLPKLLIDDIENLGLSKMFTYHSIKLVSLLSSKSYREYGVFNGFIPLPYNYLKEVYTSTYKKDFLNKLLEKKIIISNESYSFNTKSTNKKSTYCLKYRLNDCYYIDNYLSNSITNYNNITCLSFMSMDFVEPTVINELGESMDFDYCKETRRDLRKLTYNIPSLVQIAKDCLESMDFENESPWILNQRAFAYDQTIKKIEKEYFFASRNNTNSRLDSNITNMKSEMFNQICLDNDLIQIDLSNSQFALLAYVLNKDNSINLKTDFLKFKQLSSEGNLYECIQKELSLNTRKQAKNLMFELAFCEKSFNENYLKLKNLFPNVISWVEQYKKENGYKEFSVMLQKEEANIFIDNIYREIKSEGLFCLSKHDSIICKSENKDYVLEIVKHYLSNIGTIKIN